jgi:flavin-dependent dehydrogenase
MNQPAQFDVVVVGAGPAGAADAARARAAVADNPQERRRAAGSSRQKEPVISS